MSLRAKSIAARAGAMFILISVLLTLIGNRWANYIITPVTGLFLVDALYAIGAILGFANISRLRIMPPWMRWVFGIVWVYVLVVLLPELILTTGENQYRAIRDAAPYLYFGMAPFAAAALLSVSPRTLIMTARLGGTTAAGVALLVSLGILEPFGSSLLGSEFTQFFANRPDMLGAAIGVGVIAWGRWPATGIHHSFAMQGALIISGSAMLANRSGLIALVTAIAFAVYRELRYSRNLRVPLAAIILVVAGLAVQIATVATPQPATVATPQPATVATPQLSAANVTREWFSNSILKRGTTGARWATWTDIVSGMTRDSTWLFGGAAGSDYLYELCTGEPIAPDFIPSGPKCAVDTRGLQPPTRDPHNWILNIVLYHGLVGLFVFILALTFPAWKLRKTANAALPIGGIVTYLAAGMTFLISAGYALIPMSFFLAWILSNALRPTEGDESLLTHLSSEKSE